VSGLGKLRCTRGCVALLLHALTVIPSGLAWAQATGGAAHFYNSLLGIHVAGYQGWFACPGDGAVGVGWGRSRMVRSFRCRWLRVACPIRRCRVARKR
jgi:hypothetical protein